MNKKIVYALIAIIALWAGYHAIDNSSVHSGLTFGHSTQISKKSEPTSPFNTLDLIKETEEDTFKENKQPGQFDNSLEVNSFKDKTLSKISLSYAKSASDSNKLLYKGIAIYKSIGSYRI